MTTRDEWSRRRWLGALAATAAVASGAGAALAAEVVQRSTTAPEVILGALVRAILAFDDPRFPDVSPAQIEQRMSSVANLLADPEYRAGLAAFDASSASLPGTGGSFSTLPLAAARRVMAAWFESPSAQQRRFVATTKAVAVIALYSSPQVWPAIGYAGPFDEKFDAEFR